MGVDRSTCRYQARRADWPALRERLRGLAAERRRLQAVDSLESHAIALPAQQVLVVVRGERQRDTTTRGATGSPER